MLTLPSYSRRSAAYGYLIELEGAEYRFRFRWLERAGGWYVDVGAPDGTVYVAGVRVVVGWDLFYRHADPRLPPGHFLVVDTSGQGSEIRRQDELGDELGGRVRIVYVTAAEWAALTPSTVADALTVEIAP